MAFLPKLSRGRKRFRFLNLDVNHREKVGLSFCVCCCELRSSAQQELLSRSQIPAKIQGIPLRAPRTCAFTRAHPLLSSVSASWTSQSGSASFSRVDDACCQEVNDVSCRVDAQAQLEVWAVIVLIPQMSYCCPVWMCGCHSDPGWIWALEDWNQVSTAAGPRSCDGTQLQAAG